MYELLGDSKNSSLLSREYITEFEHTEDHPWRPEFRVDGIENEIDMFTYVENRYRKRSNGDRQLVKTTCHTATAGGVEFMVYDMSIGERISHNVHVVINFRIVDQMSCFNLLCNNFKKKRRIVGMGIDDYCTFVKQIHLTDEIDKDVVSNALFEAMGISIDDDEKLRSRYPKKFYLNKFTNLFNHFGMHISDAYQFERMVCNLFNLKNENIVFHNYYNTYTALMECEIKFSSTDDGLVLDAVRGTKKNITITIPWKKIPCSRDSIVCDVIPKAKLIPTRYVNKNRIRCTSTDGDGDNEIPREILKFGTNYSAKIEKARKKVSHNITIPN